MARGRPPATLRPALPRRRLRTTMRPCYKPAQRMRDQPHTTCSTLAGLGWSAYARYYAWRFS
jgi:hypothetical protein